MKLSIVIPCYNESENLPILLERFDRIINNDNLEVVLVNNGSTDDSAYIMENLLSKYTFARSVYVPVNKGYGYGILKGLDSCDSEYIGWTHADLQTDPRDVIKALEIILNNSGKQLYVKGNRKGRPIVDQFFTTGMSIFETFYMGKKLYDINAQPNIFPKSFFDKWQNPPNDFSLDLYALYMASEYGLDINRFNVIFPKRIYGQSKWNTGLKAKIKFIKRTLEFSKILKQKGIR